MKKYFKQKHHHKMKIKKNDTYNNFSHIFHVYSFFLYEFFQ